MRSIVHLNRPTKQTNGTTSAVWNEQAVDSEQEHKALYQHSKPLTRPGAAGSADGKPSPPPRIGFDFSKIPIFSPSPARIQPKLKINVPGDKYEQEAERVAEQVMRMPEPVVQRMLPTQQPYYFTVQRKCDACAKEEEKETLQAKSAGNTGGIVTPSLAQQIQSTRGGGQPMDAATRSFMETRFGTDFGGVRIHTDNNAALFSQRLRARAFTLGNDVYFNQGQYRPGVAEGRRLLVHELVHVGQQNRSITLQRKFLRSTRMNITSDFSNTIRRGEAGVHQGIEMETMGVQKPDYMKTGTLTQEQEKAMEMYAGNWMRDFSQLNVPTVINNLSSIPAGVGTQNMTSIGEAGARELVFGLLRSLASIEFGEKITKKLITPENIGSYRPQEHMDNPAGMSYAGDVVTNNHAEPLKSQLAGAAGLGSQLENAELYRVSATGLAKHIYNTREWVKSRLKASASAGPTDVGRMHLGTALHGVEDYFSHSNFIEVAINVLLADNSIKSTLPGALGTDKTLKVNTLFDQSVMVGNRNRAAITTGTFGPLDTRVSLAHAVLPLIPMLVKVINENIDRILGISDPESKDKVPENVSDAAINFMAEGMDKAGMEMQVVTLKKRWVDVSVGKPTAAIKSYQQLRARFKELMPEMPEWMQKVKDEVIGELARRVKKHLANMIYSMVEDMLGFKIPPEKRKSPEEMEKLVQENSEEMVKKTSIESRRASGDLADLSGAELTNRVPSGKLPPSHSEVGKDHPGHVGKGGGNPTLSPFYEIHRQLAIAADAHIMYLLEGIWQKSHPGASIVPGKSPTMNSTTLVDLTKEASQVAKSEAAISQKAGISHAQSDADNPPETMALLNAIDLYINHPLESTWWRNILLTYIKTHESQVLQDIRSRDQTMKDRQKN